MKQAQNGNTVKVHYTGKFTDGNIFDTSQGREPLEFALGQGMMIKGFEKTVLGMEIGQKKTTSIPPVEAYGEVNEELLFSVDRGEIPAEIELNIGMQLNAQTDNGQAIPVVVKEISEAKVLLDANHPLAGKELVFEIELLEIN